MKKTNILKIITIIIGLFLLVWYIRLPDYREASSIIFSDNDTRDTTLNVIVYKARYNPVLYEMIAEKHNKINGVPSKLTLKLFTAEQTIHSGEKPYHTVVFDYENHVEYVLLNTISNTEP